MNRIRRTGQSTVVTSGARGIGLAIATRLLESLLLAPRQVRTAANHRARL